VATVFSKTPIEVALAYAKEHCRTAGLFCTADKSHELSKTFLSGGITVNLIEDGDKVKEHIRCLIAVGGEAEVARAKAQKSDRILIVIPDSVFRGLYTNFACMGYQYEETGSPDMVIFNSSDSNTRSKSLINCAFSLLTDLIDFYSHSLNLPPVFTQLKQMLLSALINPLPFESGVKICENAQQILSAEGIKGGYEHLNARGNFGKDAHADRFYLLYLINLCFLQFTTARISDILIRGDSVRARDCFPKNFLPNATVRHELPKTLNGILTKEELSSVANAFKSVCGGKMKSTNFNKTLRLIASVSCYPNWNGTLPRLADAGFLEGILRQC